MYFTFSGFGIVVKDTIAEGRRPESTRLKFAVEVRWVWLWKRLEQEILWRLRYSNCVMFLQVSGVEYWETGGRLYISWCTRWRGHVEKG